MLTETVLLEQNRRLREENEELRETLRQLKTTDPEPLPLDVPYLTRIEERVFRSLLRHPGYISRETVLRDMYDGMEVGDNQSLRHFVSRLRKRLLGSPYGIKTVWGRGYQLVNVEPQRRAAREFSTLTSPSRKDGHILVNEALMEAANNSRTTGHVGTAV